MKTSERVWNARHELAVALDAMCPSAHPGKVDMVREMIDRLILARLAEERSPESEGDSHG